MSNYPGFSALPGSMEPGRIWPGYGALAFAGPAPVFALGTPAFRWETGEPAFRWASGSPVFQWATGEPRLS